jgi:DNA recombination protein RmuC
LITVLDRQSSLGAMLDTSLILTAVIAFVVGIAVGLFIAFVFRYVTRKSEKELQAAAESQFNLLAQKVFKASATQFLQLADQRFKTTSNEHQAELDTKKKLIDQQLVNITAQLDKVTMTIRGFENDRVQKYGELTQQLQSLSDTTNVLHSALANKSARGKWGERMAEDILRLIGFQEGINYAQQLTIPNTGTRPDFTFYLPQKAMLHMDVKFPLDNYWKYVNCENAKDQASHREKFLKDVRSRLKEVADRGYINVEQATADCVLMFIPNEQIYQFILSQDHDVIDIALQNKVILCSPLTLFAILAIIRQSTESFAIQASSREILGILQNFKTHWKEFVDKMNEIDSGFRKLRNSYSDLVGERQQSLDDILDRLDSVTAKYELSSSVQVTLTE